MRHSLYGILGSAFITSGYRGYSRHTGILNIRPRQQRNMLCPHSRKNINAIKLCSAPRQRRISAASAQHQRCRAVRSCMALPFSCWSNSTPLHVQQSHREPGAARPCPTPQARFPHQFRAVPGDWCDARWITGHAIDRIPEREPSGDTTIKAQEKEHDTTAEK